MDCSLPGFSVHGIFQARTLEWVAISLSNAWKWKVEVKPLSHVRLLATPWTSAHQASLFLTVSRSLLKLMSIESVMPFISFSVIPFSCLQSSPASGVFQLSQMLKSGSWQLSSNLPFHIFLNKAGVAAKKSELFPEPWFLTLLKRTLSFFSWSVTGSHNLLFLIGM